MHNIFTIAKRELASFFDSLTAYVMIVIFLGLSGFFTWLFGNTIFMINQANLSVFFAVSYWSLFFFIPAITMRTLAEENRSGTIELLMTKAIADWEIVTGKFLGCLFLILISLVCTLPYYFTVSSLGEIDHGAVLGGYFGLILMSATYIGIGVFSSSITSNQIVAFLMSLMIGLFFHIIFDMLASSFTGGVGSIFHYLSTRTHFDSVSRGVIDSRDMIFFISLPFLAIFMAQTMLSKRNWQS